jgi:hypothetical protein
VKWGETGWFENAACWQGNCLEMAPEILVALKRNDEYALHIKAMRTLMGFRDTWKSLALRERK